MSTSARLSHFVLGLPTVLLLVRFNYGYFLRRSNLSHDFFSIQRYTNCHVLPKSTHNVLGNYWLSP